MGSLIKNVHRVLDLPFNLQAYKRQSASLLPRFLDPQIGCNRPPHQVLRISILLNSDVANGGDNRIFGPNNLPLLSPGHPELYHM